MNTDSRLGGSEVPASNTSEARERSNRYDIELYRYACELFENAPERGQLEFEVELAALRAAKGRRENPPRRAGPGWLRRDRGGLADAPPGAGDPLAPGFRARRGHSLKHEVGDRAKAMRDELASVSSERERLAAELQAAIRGEHPAKGTAGSRRRRRSAKTSSQTQPSAADDGPADPLTARSVQRRPRGPIDRHRVNGAPSDTEGTRSDASARSPRAGPAARFCTRRKHQGSSRVDPHQSRTAESWPSARAGRSKATTPRRRRAPSGGDRGPQLAAAIEHADRIAPCVRCVQHSDRLARGDAR